MFFTLKHRSKITPQITILQLQRIQQLNPFFNLNIDGGEKVTQINRLH